MVLTNEAHVNSTKNDTTGTRVLHLIIQLLLKHAYYTVRIHACSCIFTTAYADNLKCVRTKTNISEEPQKTFPAKSNVSESKKSELQKGTNYGLAVA